MLHVFHVFHGLARFLARESELNLHDTIRIGDFLARLLLYFFPDLGEELATQHSGDVQRTEQGLTSQLRCPGYAFAVCSALGQLIGLRHCCHMYHAVQYGCLGGSLGCNEPSVLSLTKAQSAVLCDCETVHLCFSMYVIEMYRL